MKTELIRIAFTLSVFALASCRAVGERSEPDDPSVALAREIHELVAAGKHVEAQEAIRAERSAIDEFVERRSATIEARRALLPRLEGDALAEARSWIASASKELKELRARIEFTEGYAAQKFVADDEAVQRRMLESAVVHYENFLELYPGHVQGTRNLVLVRRALGQRQRAVELLLGLIRSQPDRAFDAWIHCGDIEYEAALAKARKANAEPQPTMDSIRRAVEYYSNAEALRPGSPVVRDRLLAVHVRLASVDAAGLMEHCQELHRSGSFETALEGYEALIHATWERDSRTAAEGCMGWLACVAALGRTDPAELSRLPIDRWEHVCVVEMQRLFTESVGPDSIRWWSSELEAMQAAAEFLRVRARDELHAGRLDTSAALLDLGLFIAPSFEHYAGPPLEGRDWIVLDVATDLARIQLTAEGSDAEEQISRIASDFRDIESMLFRDKGAAIRARDFRAMQKFHTTLALLYAEREEPRWNGDHVADGALFQLAAALNAAKRREDEGFPYQPLPRLKRLLAQGKWETSEGNDRGKREAYDLTLDAVEAYLDLDNLNESDATLQLAATRRPDSVTGPDRHHRLRSIIALREAVERLDKDAIEAGAHARIAGVMDTILSAPDGSAESARFVSRQRFKALADLGEKVAQAGRVIDGIEFQRAAMAAAASSTSLASYADVQRLRTYEQTVAPWAGLGSHVTAIPVSYGADPGDVDERWAGQWKVAGSSTAPPTWVGLPNDLVVASRILPELRTSRPEAEESFRTFDVDQGMIFIDTAYDEAAIATLEDRIRSIEGVRSVRPAQEIPRRK